MKKMTLLCAVLVSSVAAIAQTPEEAPDAPTTAKAQPSQDPNEVVCVQEAEVGSRLNRRRVCRTRAEWAEHRTQYKQSIERAQSRYRPRGNKAPPPCPA